MKSSSNPYAGYRYLAHTVWLYHRFCLSLRDVEELLAERGIEVTYETIRQWCLRFGQSFAKSLRRRQGRPGDTWFLDEVFVKIGGELHYLWRAVDQDGDVIDVLVQKQSDKRAAKRFFRQLLKGLRYAPRKIVTDKLRSYGAARKELLPSVIHEQGKWMNNRVEVSRQPTRQRERQKRKFKSMRHTQRFLSVHGPITNLFRLCRHGIKAKHYRIFRDRAFAMWREVMCVQEAS